MCCALNRGSEVCVVLLIRGERGMCCALNRREVCVVL